MPPRKPTAESANIAPAPSPSSVDFRSAEVPGLSAMVTTPVVAIRIAAAMTGVTASPRKTRPNSATCTGSVLI